MAININTDPYYDDFDKTKGFHQILFKPGVAVQARELTQIQSILQNQIKSFGDNIFKEGALIQGGHQSLDTQYHSVKLTAAADSTVLSLIDQEIYGLNSGIRAKVVNATQATVSGDPPTIFIKYLNSGKSKEKSGFAQSELIWNEAKTVSVTTAATSVNAVGTAYTMTNGIIYVGGFFVYFADQTAILNKYGSITNIIVGFDVKQTIKDFTDDASLNDPANGSYNYAAPGADRLQVALTLTNRPWQADDVADPDFVEIARIQNKSVISAVTSTAYNILGDTLARRTYDESGDYVVRPYDLSMVEHKRTSLSTNDGYYTVAEGGDANKFINKISPGKAYVKGYEIDNVKSAAIPADKARDTASVESGSVYTPFGNYVRVTNINGVSEEIDNLPEVQIYSQFTATPGIPEGVAIGTARIRHTEFFSGTPGTTTAQYNVYLFDIKMKTGYSFTNDAKQIVYINSVYSSDFTADVVEELANLTGTISTVGASSTIQGIGTRFLTELDVGNYINVDGSTHRVISIIDDTGITVSPDPIQSRSGYVFSSVKSKLWNTDRNSYIFPLPVTIVKSIDPTGVDTIYQTRRVYERTLTNGVVQVDAGVNESFSSFSLDNMQMYVANGDVVDITGDVTITGASNTVLTVDVSAKGYTTETVILVVTVSKNGSAADKKIKTLVSNSQLDITSEATSTAQSISLGKGDIYRLVSVKMTTTGVFGDATYNSTTEVDITNRYTLDNGQKATYYGLGSLRLKRGSNAPTGPIRITFDYFTHGTGDYFSVDSYSIDYKDIPTLILGGNEYVLRDCLDFRPKINDAGTGFSGTGSSVGEFPDFENDITTAYEYYLPRTDKIVINRDGRIKVIKGESGFDAKEPATPEDSMVLYILKQKPYVFNISTDIDIVKIDNRRFTMRQIGKLENRIKNIEYYTSLNQLEVNTQNYQIKDINGFDKFKNGFVVDSFQGHGIGDVYNADYGVAIDYQKRELRPLCKTEAFTLKEVATTDAERTAAGYAKTGDLYTLPYTEERMISNNRSSKVENLNPYDVVSFRGKMKGKQSDIWIDTIRLPDLPVSVDNYSSLTAAAKAKGTYGTVWGSWETVHFGTYQGTQEIGTRVGTETTYTEEITTETKHDIVRSSSVIAKMRDVAINFEAEGLMPDTRMYIFMNNENVTAECKSTLLYEHDLVAGDTKTTINAIGQQGKMIATDDNGKLKGTFHYSAEKWNWSTGSYIIRMTDDYENNQTYEFTSAEMTFTSSGELQNIQNEIVSTRNAIVTSKPVIESTSRTNYFEGGKLKGKSCKGFDLYEERYDGAGGTYETLVDAKNTGVCGYVKPIITPLPTEPDPPVVVQTCPPGGTILNTYCDEVTFNLMATVAAGPDGNGKCSTTEVITETGSTQCTPVNPCEPNGTPAQTFCKNGTDLWGQYFDGTYNYVTGDCNTYQSLIQANNVEDCKYVNHPAAGVPTGNTECFQPGYIKYVEYHDGVGGTYKNVEEYGSAECGYVSPVEIAVLEAAGTVVTQEEKDLAEIYDPTDPIAAGTHNRYECRGYDYYEMIADGNWGETAVLIEANSEYYCNYTVPKDTIYIETFVDLDADDDDDGDLDPPRAQVVDTLGFINGIFNYAFGSNMTESDRVEADAYLASKGITADTLANATTSGSNIVDGYIDADQVPSAYNEDAEKLGLAIKTMIEVGVARGYGADSDASVTNYLNTVEGSTVETISNQIAIQAVTAATQIDNPAIDESWAKEAVRLLINNTTEGGSLI
jgi:hypothetical protein